MIPDGILLIRKEAEHQCAKWGFEHDLIEHGSAQLMAAASILLTGFDGNPDDCAVPWAIKLHTKHANDFVRRCMIAGAMCASAINARTFELGSAARAPEEG